MVIFRSYFQDLYQQIIKSNNLTKFNYEITMKDQKNQPQEEQILDIEISQENIKMNNIPNFPGKFIDSVARKKKELLNQDNAISKQSQTNKTAFLRKIFFLKISQTIISSTQADQAKQMKLFNQFKSKTNYLQKTI
ncbi:hypothetical protein ABPG72_017276 [Tetrahymena utriculariae]